MTVQRWAGAGALALALFAPAAQAGLFDDDEARKAILDLRQKLEQSNEAQRQRQAELNNQMAEQIAQLKKSLLDLNAQLEMLRADNARLRGQDEQLTRDVAELQRKVKDTQQGVDDRMRKLEPQKVTVDGREFMADPEEKRQYEEAMNVFRRGEFDPAAQALSGFVKRFPSSGYSEAATFWLGNAYFGKRDFKNAISTFRSFVSAHADATRAPEALLAIANCEAELKDNKAARKTIGELIKAYPKSEAAQAGRERLASLK
ncbi:tol-pal system protein YbgF [Piscinibacter terrae]|uniref:Cell division coordinator CpoB n=1 Tax=Piscinibacter terrae TaxID=2496871 RepID=A0A3N7HWD6_9BURK|nr:tol-pal system protein YbgF [Albitalea terrae]RQP25716.1 tol-pal system protein YbgF [Albitalea terrae]